MAEEKQPGLGILNRECRPYIALGEATERHQEGTERLERMVEGEEEGELHRNN